LRRNEVAAVVVVVVVLTIHSATSILALIPWVRATMSRHC
jgi:hypothetical protein